MAFAGSHGMAILFFFSACVTAFRELVLGGANGQIENRMKTRIPCIPRLRQWRRNLLTGFRACGSSHAQKLEGGPGLVIAVPCGGLTAAICCRFTPATTMRKVVWPWLAEFQT